MSVVHDQGMRIARGVLAANHNCAPVDENAAFILA
jgi:hypothetical protein